MPNLLFYVTHQLILVDNFKLWPETSVDRDPAHQSGTWNRWFGMFGIDFSSKLTRILFIISHEFITESFKSFHWVSKSNPQFESAYNLCLRMFIGYMVNFSRNAVPVLEAMFYKLGTIWIWWCEQFLIGKSGWIYLCFSSLSKYYIACEPDTSCYCTFGLLLLTFYQRKIYIALC
jgi:hypothetical protein